MNILLFVLSHVERKEQSKTQALKKPIPQLKIQVGLVRAMRVQVVVLD